MSILYLSKPWLVLSQFAIATMNIGSYIAWLENIKVQQVHLLFSCCVDLKGEKQNPYEEVTTLPLCMSETKLFIPDIEICK